MLYPLIPLIALAIGFGASMFYIRKCMDVIDQLKQQIHILRMVDQELNKQQLMEAQAIQDLAEMVIKNKYKSSKSDTSDPIFKTPHGEA